MAVATIGADNQDPDDAGDADAGDDPVFKALADRTRRDLLDTLFADDGQSLGQLCARFPDLTRFAVMKHLRVLEAANLITTVRAGRIKLHHLNPVPIHQIAGRWLDKYAVPITGAMLGLKHDLESRSADTKRG